MKKVRTESAIIFLISAVQFINVLDFMMVMPLGPDFSTGLGIPPSKLGLIGGSYTAAASVSGLLGAFFLDKFDRRKALVVAILGLTLGTLAGGFAFNLSTLIMARLLAGCFGGPATSLCISIISDIIPPERRGRAMGAVMGSFSIASVLGVPIGLELAQRGTWRTPFFSVAFMAALIGVVTYILLPSMTGHINKEAAKPDLKSFFKLISKPIVLKATLVMFLGMFGAFVMIPNIASYLQFNASYPREQMGVLYFFGGFCSFFAMRFSGRSIDSHGVLPVLGVATTILVANLFFGFYFDKPLIPALLAFVLFMTSMSVRNVSMNTLITKIPRPFERARFQSFQSCIQHLSAAFGAMAGTFLLQETAEHHLVGMWKISSIAMVSCGLLPLLLHHIEKQIKNSAF